MNFTILLVSILFFVFVVTSGRYVRVTTKQGQLVGKRKTYSYKAGEVTNVVDSFLGIPYATPPTGELRFKDPLPWTGQHGGRYIQVKPACKQIMEWFTDIIELPDVEVGQSEDCLHLNIFSPKEKNDKLYPVMMYIHGGSLLGGTGNWFDGHVLAQFGVVIVSINYRLQALGYLTDGNSTSDLPGDYGIFDQIMALKWIQKNIRAFRGDPDKVTIFGNSAGGWSVSLHLILEQSKGLFHRAIVQSGPLNAAVSHATIEEVASDLSRVAQKIGCSGTPADVKKCVREANATTITQKYNNPTQAVLYVGSRTLPQDPTFMLRNAPLNNVPVMIGNVAHEVARFFSAMDNVDWFPITNKGMLALHEITEEKLIKATRFILGAAFLDLPYRLQRLVLHEYRSWTTLDDEEKTVESFINMMSDIIMIAPTVQMASILHSRGVQPYLYLFSHKMMMDLKHEKVTNFTWLSNYSYHESELPYVFGAPVSRTAMKSVWHTSEGYTDADRFVSVNVMRLWTNFAKFGEPTRVGVAPQDIQWTPFNPETTDYLDIGTTKFEMKQNLRAKKVDFWNKVMPALEEGIVDDEGMTPPPVIV